MKARRFGMVSVAAGLSLLVPTACGGQAARVGTTCHSSQLHAALGPPVSEATGQHTLIVTLSNTGRRCVLDGYPTLAFYDGSGRLPFRVSHRGDQMITGRLPQPVRLAGRATAVVMLNKYRCDLGDRRTPSRLTLGLARDGDGVAVSLPPTARDMSWCGAGDPGSTIDITPFEPSVQAAGR